MLRTSLVYPPFVSENRAFPPLSLPALTAFLRLHGYLVSQVDLNIEFYRWVTRDERLQELHSRLETALASHSGLEPSLAGLDYYCNLSDAVHVWMPYIRAAMKECGGDLSALDGTRCLYLLDKLALILGLERRNHKTAVEMTSDELLEEIRREDGSLFAHYIRDHAVPRILAGAPDVVGMSLMIEQQLFPALILAHYLKLARPSLYVVIGGGLVSAVADKIGKKSTSVFSLVDAFVAFDGEQALLRLLESLEQGQSRELVPNIIYFDRSSNSVRSTPVLETGSLDDLPLPDFEGLDFSLYTRRIMPYYVSKGCAYGRCAYCSDPAYSSARNRTPEKAVAEIEALVSQYHPDTLLFVDSYIHPRYMEPISRGMIERKVRVKWVTQTRMDRFLTSDCVKVFAESGCSELWFGMETVNPRMIRLIRKGSKKEIIMRILDDCWQAGIKVTLNCMIGFPTETAEEAHDTMDFIDTLNQIYPELVFKCNTGFVFVPRLSAFGKSPEQFGITVVDEFEWSPRLEWLPPEWRFQERFRALDGQIFEKSYEGAQAVREQMKQEHSFSVSRSSSLGISQGCYLASARSNLVQLWKKLFDYQLAILSLQREHTCTKDAAVRILEEQLQTDAALQGAYHSSAVYAYVVEDGSWRRMVPLTEVYQLIISCIEPGISAGQVCERIQELYPEHSPDQVEHAVLFALEFLARSGVIEVDEVRLDKPIDVWPSPVFNRRNLGQTSAEEDCDPVEEQVSGCAHEGGGEVGAIRLVQIQNAV